MRESAGSDGFLYFAYGSNMLTRRLRATDRAPSAIAITRGYVAARRLTFLKPGRDGSGKCDAQASEDRDDRVYGVVFQIAPTDKPALDNAEGLGNGYHEEILEVITPARTLSAWAYVASRRQPGLRPFTWYKSLALAGAIEHGLPDDYVARLTAVDAIADPDPARQAYYEALLANA